LPLDFFKVSNPWREAIEVSLLTLLNQTVRVSNPWREAIEENVSDHNWCGYDGFQSLEGGY